MRRVLCVLVLTAGLVAGTGRSAYADATLFVGTVTEPSSRLVKGFSGGFSLIIVGFEFEYASVSEDPANLTPSLRTWMGNLLLQTPDVGSFQLYVTTGGGFFRERLDTKAETNFGVNTGGGIKIPLAGPLRLRLDYRFIKLRGTPIHTQSQRLYAGLNLKF